MGSPVSPIVANIFMSNFEEKILSTYTPSPKVWCRFVGDAFVIWKQSEKETFFEFLNNQCFFIKFTMELENSSGILFLDCKITRSLNDMPNFQENDTFRQISGILFSSLTVCWVQCRWKFIFNNWKNRHEWRRQNEGTGCSFIYTPKKTTTVLVLYTG